MHPAAKCFGVVGLLFASEMQAQWVEATIAPEDASRIKKRELDAGSITELQGYRLINSRIIFVENAYPYNSQSSAYRVDEKAILEVNCAKKIYRVISRELRLSDGSILRNRNTTRPQWLDFTNVASGSVYHVACSTAATKSSPKLAFEFGAVTARPKGRNYEIEALAVFDKSRVSISVFATACDAGFGDLFSDFGDPLRGKATRFGNSTADVAFVYLCEVGMGEVERVMGGAASQNTPTPRDASGGSSALEALVIQDLIRRPEPSPSPPQRPKTETVCKFNPISQSTKCETVEKP